MKRLVILTGAGISAESGLKTFRGAAGLWEGHRVEDVASPEAWARDQEMVLQFYNERREQLEAVEPNAGHLNLVELEKYFDVQVVTQNVDDLHERAGSTKVLHLHGELRKCRCSVEEELVYQMESPILKKGDTCPNGHQLRPHIVWFGEEVPKLPEAAYHFSRADIQVVVGTSLQVYPAAGLINYAPGGIPSYLVDPGDFGYMRGFKHIKEGAGTGTEKLLEELEKLA